MKLCVKQSYLLPFSFIRQIEHILDVKHLESTHAFSLNKLKVFNIKRLPSRIEFCSQSSSFLLSFLRKQHVESIIYIESLFEYRLDINKNVSVLFNINPLGSLSHHLFTVEVYTNFSAPINFLLKPFISTAIFLTMYEDMEYWHERIR